MIGIDLFAGAGGLSLGAQLAGINVKVAVESDPYAAETYQFNHPETIVLTQDVRKIKSVSVPLKQKVILFGGPPCQGFSTSNQKTRNVDNPNNWLFKEFLRIARIVKPDWIVFENVTGILGTDGGSFAEDVIKKLKKMKYTTSSWVLTASDYGVPQNRSRLFIVASANGVVVEKPKPVSSKKKVTVREAIADLPSLENGASTSKLPYRHAATSLYARKMRKGKKQCENNLVTNNAKNIISRYRHIPEGGNWENIPARLMKNYTDRTRCHTGIYHRLTGEKPSVVIGNFRKNMLIHPSEDRGLSVREAARIQSFPDSYVFQGSIGFQQQQVGNAVPPLLAQKVFEQILLAEKSSPKRKK